MRKRKEADLWLSFVHALDQSPRIATTVELSTLLGGDITKWDLAIQLERYFFFASDGLSLTKEAVMSTSTIGELYNLVYF